MPLIDATSPDRFALALAGIDAANAADPERVMIDGQPVPREVAYAHRMTAWLARLYPDAPEPLRLAARAQHVRRWERPRSTFPMDRAGYLAWRTSMYDFHADVTAAILRDVGYDDATVARVRSLLRKERLKADPDAQALEDVVGVVFLETEFAAFAPKHDEAKVVNILRRTWAKMSPVGRNAALTLDMPADLRRLVEKALAAPPAISPHV